MSVRDTMKHMPTMAIAHTWAEAEAYDILVRSTMEDDFPDQGASDEMVMAAAQVLATFALRNAVVDMTEMMKR